MTCLLAASPSLTHNGPVAQSTTRRRLPAGERRELLLDAATAVLQELGPDGVTMEGIAARAGVNKALPYRHFDNAQAVLVELYVRFNRELGSRILAAVAAEDTVEDRIAAAVSAFFDVARDNRALLLLLGRTPEAGSITADAEARTGAQQFLIGLMTESFGVPRRDALAVAEVMVGALAAAVRAWGRQLGSRRALERVACGALLGAVQASKATPAATGR